MVEDRIWTLLARQCTGEATAAELLELERLLEQDPALKNTARKMIAAWQDPGSSHMQKALASFSRLDAKIQERARTISPAGEPAPVHTLPSFIHRYRIAFTAAAACIVLMATTWLVLHNNSTVNRKNLAMQEVTSPAKSIRKVQLPDGSAVWLNEGSTMGYHEAFNRNTREVWLTGEAFFDVVKNAEKPFLIHANKVNVKVLGTAFNVRSYPGEKMVETSLVRGSVEITVNDRPDKKYVLKPNQKLVVPVNMADTVVTAASGQSPDSGDEVRYALLGKVADNDADSVIAEISWMDHKLAFYQSSFKDLAIRLEKRYDVSFVFKNSHHEALVFTGVFYQQPLPQILHALSLTAVFHYRIQDSTVYIY